MTELQDKTLVMVVGPTSIGKSTVMNEVVRIHADFGRVKSFTTRPPRPNDERNQYFYLSDSELADMDARGVVITNVLYPTTGYRYGTISESYSSKFNLLDTLSHSVSDYKKLSFQRTVTVSLTAASQDWKHWLDSRFPEKNADYKQRLDEAIQSIRWSLTQTQDHYWVVNNPADLPRTAKKIIEAAISGTTTQTVPQEAKQLLRTAEQLQKAVA